ncbi:MAG TPA: rod shape-determining protein MreC [Candidatus Methylomirabilis sp.]|nr:rod shape-determining protein MreC [Candidatus Methylomirabilis sp.]
MKKINLKVIALFIATVGLLIFFHLAGWLRPVEAAVGFIFNPVAAELHSWSSALRLKYDAGRNTADLSAQIGILEKKVEELTVKNAALEKVEEENVKLRQQLNFLNTGAPKKYLLANVISRQVFSGPEERQGDLVIDKGRADGLTAGLVVLDEKGAVAGKITAVEEKNSRFTLVTEPVCKLAAMLSGSGLTAGATSGNLGLTINLNFIPQVQTVNVGDLVATSGLEPGIPGGLAIGTVTKVNRGSNEIWQSADLEPSANLDDLTIVSVLIP